jgi:hypothetical protein
LAHTDEIQRRSKVGFEGQTGNGFLSPAPPLLTQADVLIADWKVNFWEKVGCVARRVL